MLASGHPKFFKVRFHRWIKWSTASEDFRVDKKVCNQDWSKGTSSVCREESREEWTKAREEEEEEEEGAVG
jgi:hypothetical protein